MILSRDGVVIKEVELTKERTTLGRRPYNDIVIDHLAISGEHAALHWLDGAVELQDLDSTNGSYVNGKSVRRQVLADGDLLEMGKHQVRFLNDDDADDSGDAAGQAQARRSRFSAQSLHETALAPLALDPAAPAVASVTVLSGNAAGREVVLTKVVTTIGKPGTAIASITRRQHGFVLAHVEGPDRTVLNGTAIGTSSLPLSSGDLIELAGTQMRFVQA